MRGFDEDSIQKWVNEETDAFIFGSREYSTSAIRKLY